MRTIEPSPAPLRNAKFRTLGDPAGLHQAPFSEWGPSIVCSIFMLEWRNSSWGHWTMAVRVTRKIRWDDAFSLGSPNQPDYTFGS